MDAEAICRKSMTIATSIDVMSNNDYNIDSLEKDDNKKKTGMISKTTLYVSQSQFSI